MNETELYSGLYNELTILLGSNNFQLLNISIENGVVTVSIAIIPKQVEVLTNVINGQVNGGPILSKIDTSYGIVIVKQAIMSIGSINFFNNFNFLIITIFLSFLIILNF